MNTFAWWRMLVVGLVCSGMTVLVGCTDSSSKDKPSSISGDSFLRVQNDFTIKQEISFNGSYIGDVGAGASRTWSVPSGTFEVAAKDDSTGTSRGVYTFRRGQTTLVRVFGSSRSRERATIEGLEGEKLGIPDDKNIAEVQ